MENHLVDTDIYTVLQRNFVKKLLKNLKKLLKNWVNSKYISAETQFFKFFQSYSAEDIRFAQNT